MITLDFETKSYADLKKVGTWAYSEHATTDVICACWGVDDGPIQEWWPGKNKTDEMPADLWDAIRTGHLVEAHYVAFERSIWVNVMARRYGWPVPPDHAWRCTMAVACYYGLPAALNKLARVLGFELKDPAGERLITKYSKLYLKTAKTEIPEEDFRRFVDYCAHDVRMEQSISDRLGDFPERELPVFLLDQEVNMRGIHLDQEGVDAATAVVEQRSGELAWEFEELTGLQPTQRDKVMTWCAREGVVLENMQAGYLAELLEDGDLPQGDARRALEIRLAINKASTKKLDAMSRQRGSDGRARFQTRYHGAVTGRSTGSGFQPLNLHRGYGEEVAPEQLVRDIMYRDPEWLDAAYGDAMDAVARASRHWIVAPRGRKIVAGDFVSVEAVILACLAGEQWKVDAFARGEPVYERTAEKIYDLPPGTVTKETHPLERQDGKTCELAFGYQGALGAWLKFDSSGRWTDEEIIEKCKKWRAVHPAIVKFWRNLEDAAIDTVGNLGHIVQAGHFICFERVDEWLTMVLPNGKRLWYFDPQLRACMPQWHRPASEAACAAGACDCQPRTQVTYMAQKEGRWRRVHSYGGKWAENATQATAREVLVDAEVRVEEAGYPIVLTVYDEVICEVPESRGSAEELAEIMAATTEDWCREWPIRATAWEGMRYRK